MTVQSEGSPPNFGSFCFYESGRSSSLILAPTTSEAAPGIFQENESSLQLPYCSSFYDGDESGQSSSSFLAPTISEAASCISQENDSFCSHVVHSVRSNIRGDRTTILRIQTSATTISSGKQRAARGRDRGPTGVFLANEEFASTFLFKAKEKYLQLKASGLVQLPPPNLLTGCSLVFNFQPGPESDIFYKDGERPIKFLEFDLEVRSHDYKIVSITVPLVARLHIYNSDSVRPIGNFVEQLPPKKRRLCEDEDLGELSPPKKEPLSYRKTSSLLLENGKASVGIKPNALSKSFKGNQFVVVFYIDVCTEPFAPNIMPVWSRPFEVKSKVPASFYRRMKKLDVSHI